METKTKDPRDGRPVVVSTNQKGVFFGYIPQNQPTDVEVIRIEQARMGLRFTDDIRGFMGLASDGPSKNCRVSNAVPAITLQGVVSVVETTPEAAKRWEDGPWAR